VALGALAFAAGPGWLGGALAALTVAGGSVFLATLAISRQVGGSGAFRVGERVPDFTAPDESGAPFNLSSLAGRPLLLKFFRGHW
jgi:cytochrome oxidase Cu insertion factor (SCO1/SenC/PrrC family)